MTVKVQDNERNGTCAIYGLGYFPLDFLEVTEDSGKIRIWDPVQLRFLALAPWQDFVDASDNAFPDGPTALAYVQEKVRNDAKFNNSQVGVADPVLPGENVGDIYVNLTTNAWFEWTGSSWLFKGSSASGEVLFPIWAEENSDASGSAGGFQYAFGNGANTIEGDGIVLPFDCELVAGSLSLAGTATVTVEIRESNAAGTSSTVAGLITTVNARHGYVNYTTPVLIEAGNAIGFRTQLGSTSSNRVSPTAWLRKV